MSSLGSRLLLCLGSAAILLGEARFLVLTHDEPDLQLIRELYPDYYEYLIIYVAAFAFVGLVGSLCNVKELINLFFVAAVFNSLLSVILLAVVIGGPQTSQEYISSFLHDASRDPLDLTGHMNKVKDMAMLANYKQLVIFTLSASLIANLLLALLARMSKRSSKPRPPLNNRHVMVNLASQNSNLPVYRI